MIKAYLEQAIKSIEADRERAVSDVRERIMREKIIPYNTDIDTSRARALAEIDNELNTRISALKQEYEVKKQELIRLGEEEKKTNAEAVLASELAVVTVEYDAHIAKLTAQISEIKE